MIRDAGRRVLCYIIIIIISENVLLFCFCVTSCLIANVGYQRYGTGHGKWFYLFACLAISKGGCVFRTHFFLETIASFIPSNVAGSCLNAIVLFMFKPTLILWRLYVCVCSVSPASIPADSLNMLITAAVF